MTLVFTDPIAAKLYLEEFGPKSVKPLVAYLWDSKKPEDAYADDFQAFAAESDIRPVELDELVPELIDSELKQIRIDPAVYVKGYAAATGATGGVIVFTHDQSPERPNGWVNSTLLILQDDESLTKLINQLTIEGDYVFNEKNA